MRGSWPSTLDESATAMVKRALGDRRKRDVTSGSILKWYTEPAVKKKQLKIRTSHVIGPKGLRFDARHSE